MDDYISDLAEINQSSEYLVKNLGNFSKINNKLIRKYIDTTRLLKKNMCFTKVKNIIDKTIKYNDSKTSGNFGPAIIITKFMNLARLIKDEFAELGNADLIKLKEDMESENADLEVREQRYE
jgi:hypothetical protein